MKGDRQNQLIIFFVSVVFFISNNASVAAAQTKRKNLLLMEIRSEINPQMNRYVKLALAEAKKSGADAVAIEMNTYGGALQDADEIRTAILEFPKPVIVFINKNAASAGALISLACDSIYMAPGANIGAATVVTGDGTPAGGKYQSYMRSIMRSTAEANKRNPGLAEAMVDEDLAADSLNQAGKVLSLTTDEAIKLGFCEKKIGTFDEAIAAAGFSEYQQNKFKLSVSDKIIAFFLNPFVSGILILLIIGGIYFEFQHPGMVFPIALAFLALGLYFIPYYLNGLAENWEIVLFFIGVILLALEIFVIPGFGVTGVSGIILMLGSLVLAMLGNKAFDFSLIEGDNIIRSVISMLAGLAGGIILIIFASYKFTSSSRFMKNIALSNVQDRNAGYTSNFNAQSMVGEEGIAFTVLRPSGKIMIGGTVYDAYSRGEYIEKDTPVIVISDEGTSLKVKSTRLS